MPLCQLPSLFPKIRIVVIIIIYPKWNVFLRSSNGTSNRFIINSPCTNCYYLAFNH